MTEESSSDKEQPIIKPNRITFIDEERKLSDVSRHRDSTGQRSTRFSQAQLNEQQQLIEDLDEEWHTVRFAVNIVASFPIDSALNEPVKSRMPDGPKPINFYRFEYQLFPDDPETFIGADVVVYKSAVKLYPDKLDPRVIKGWEVGNKIWVTWNQSHEVKITKSKLLKLFNYDFVMKIWDSKDFCSARTRFDKPRPFKFSKAGEQSEEVIKSLVLEQCENYLKQMPVELQERLPRKLPSQIKFDTPDWTKYSNTQIDIIPNPVGLRLVELASQNNNNLNVTTTTIDDNPAASNSKRNTLQTDTQVMSKASKLSSLMSDSKTPRQHQRHPKGGREKTRREMLAEQDFIKKNGVTRVVLKMKTLFSGRSSISERLKEPITQTLDDCLVSINLMDSLMSDQQLNELNPITIFIQKLSDLPNKPIDFETLKENCENVYCSYKFFTEPLYQTISHTHESEIYFNEINVYLAGLLPKPELHEFMHASLFEIEVHDRDRKAKTTSTTTATTTTELRKSLGDIKPCLFGNDPTIDSQISSVNSVAYKHTLHNPFERNEKRWNNYGLARFDLHEIIIGKRLVEFDVPVLPCSAPDVLGKSSAPRDAGRRLATQRLIASDDHSRPIPSGAYLESDTRLSVRISIAKPLFDHQLLQDEIVSMPVDQQTCPYGKVIIRVKSSDTKSIKKVIDLVQSINANTLNITNISAQIETALSTYKLTDEELQNRSLNIIGGFHLIDVKNNLFVLEGLKSRGLKQICEILQAENEANGDKRVEIIYNTALSFSSRIYTELEVDLVKVKLFEPLEELVKKPLLYIRDMAPKKSFEALIKLNQLLKEYKLRDVIRCDLLPSSQMILSMNKEFGVPLSESEMGKYMTSTSITAAVESKTLKETSEEAAFKNDLFENATSYLNNTSINKGNGSHTSRVWTPLDNLNVNFINMKRDKKDETRQFIDENKKLIGKISEENKHKKPVKHYLTVDDAPYHYSSQALNSTEIGLKTFRDHLKQTNKVNKQLYSYSPEFHHSSTFVPVDVEEIDKENQVESIKRWKTLDGWVYPGIKTSIQSNEHPRKLDQASLDELNEPWEENYLHAYKMKSPLDRRFYPHTMRNFDFNVWSTRRGGVLDESQQFPGTIFDAGDTKENHEKDVQIAEKEKWKSKIIVESPRVKTHRVSTFTEQKSVGFGSSNQLDRLKDILKSEPKKKGLLTGGVTFNNIPALYVTNKEYSETEKLANDHKGYTPGESSSRRITDYSNVIPVHNYEHKRLNALRGRDFDNFSMPSRSPIYKRSVDFAESQQNNMKSHVYIVPNHYDIEKQANNTFTTHNQTYIDTN